jgi:hypothetical protein
MDISMKFILLFHLTALAVVCGTFQDTLINDNDEPDVLEYEWKQITALLKTMQKSQRKVIIRQRFSYSPSLNGWGLMNKGWISVKGTDLMFVLEQDPGEMQGTDHAVFAVKSRQLPGFDQLIIGDFRIRTIASRLYDLPSLRLGSHPSNLIQSVTIDLRPHYSTRESYYLHGAGGLWRKERLQVVGFVSSKNELGRWVDGKFIEESNGIHPVGHSFSSLVKRTAGLMMTYNHEGTSLGLGSRIDDGHNLELGLEQKIGKHIIQILCLGNQGYFRGMIIASLRSDQLWISSQFRFSTGRDNLSSSPRQSFSPGNDTQGSYSFRLLGKPLNFITIQLAVDGTLTTSAVRMDQLAKNNRQHVRSILKFSKRQIQLDLSRRRVSDAYSPNVWMKQRINENLKSMSMALNQEISKRLRYRLNLKTASLDSLRSFLIQQRLQWLFAESWKIDIGYVRYTVPYYKLALTIYETGLRESYSFYSAHGDGQRWYIHMRFQQRTKSMVEFRLAQTESFQAPSMRSRFFLGFQLSIVL